MTSANGKKRVTDVADAEQLLRLGSFSPFHPPKRTPHQALVRIPVHADRCSGGEADRLYVKYSWE